ncbi:MAG: hypothetical protein D6693_02660, partial [Planctomycetota bacterium]
MAVTGAGPTGAARRRRFAAISAGIVLAATAAAVIAQAAAQRASRRIDLTATREHTLAPRTGAILDRLDRDVEIVVVADPARLPRDLWRRTRDTLDALDRGSDRLRVTRINPVTDAGRAEFRSLRERVRAMYDADTARRADTLERAARTARALPGRFAALSDALLATKGLADDHAEALDRAAAVARLAGRAVEPTIEPAERAARAEPPDP